MNQDQRKFLIERVNQTFYKQEKTIKAGRTEKPSLNNYLVAAFLDNSIQFNDIEKLKEKMRKMVLKFGASEQLIKTKSRFNSDKDENTVEIGASDIFVMPEAYLKALREWEEENEKTMQQLEKLEAERDTILLKIQIGSNQVLDKLVTQVDNLADLNVMNTQFMLT